MPRLADFRRKPAASWAPAPRATRPKNANPRQLSVIGVRTAPVEATAQCRAARVSASIGMDHNCQPAVGGLNVFRGRCRSEVEKLDYRLLSDPDGAVATAYG